MNPPLGSAHGSQNNHSDGWILLARILKQGLHKQEEKVSSNAAFDCACNFGFGSGRKNRRATGAAASFYVFGSGSRIGLGWPRSGGAKAGTRRAEGSGADRADLRRQRLRSAGAEAQGNGGRRVAEQICEHRCSSGRRRDPEAEAGRSSKVAAKAARSGGEIRMQSHRAPRSGGEIRRQRRRDPEAILTAVAGSGSGRPDQVRICSGVGDGRIRAGAGAGAGWPDPGREAPDLVRQGQTRQGSCWIWSRSGRGAAESGREGSGSGPADSGECRIWAEKARIRSGEGQIWSKERRIRSEEV